MAIHHSPPQERGLFRATSKTAFELGDEYEVAWCWRRDQVDQTVAVFEGGSGRAAAMLGHADREEVKRILREEHGMTHARWDRFRGRRGGGIFSLAPSPNPLKRATRIARLAVALLILSAGLLALSGCASTDAGRAREAAIGMSFDDLESRLGVPDKTDILRDGSLIAMWTRAQNGNATTIPLQNLAALPVTLPLSLTGSISLNDSGDCHATARVRRGVVESFEYAGDSGGLSGPNAKCWAIVRALLADPPARK